MEESQMWIRRSLFYKGKDDMTDLGKVIDG